MHDKTLRELQAEIAELEKSYYVSLAQMEEEMQEEAQLYLADLRRLQRHGLELAAKGVTFASLRGCEFGV